MSSSPRPWGCFPTAGAGDPRRPVFPTPVGVFLKSWASRLTSCRLPHARGGVSGCSCAQTNVGVSSPRPWGCFLCKADQGRSIVVFPTPVGVFPPESIQYVAGYGLPHARGGVSKYQKPSAQKNPSSPRPWGCFLPSYRGFASPGVFPTPVGVFLADPFPVKSCLRLPHARGGVSVLVSLVL